MRVMIQDDPFAQLTQEAHWRQSSRWPAWWIGVEGAQAPFVAAFRLRFTANEPGEVRLHVSADERYELFLDGERLGRGPERGAPDFWFFETYQLALTPGMHCLSATVWALGDIGMEGQMTANPGFLLAAEGDWNARLSTGLAEWEGMLLKGYSFHPTNTQRGCRFDLDGRKHAWGHEEGKGRGWKAVRKIKQAMGRWTDFEFFHNHRLYPAILPELYEAKVPAGAVRHVDAARGTPPERNAVRIEQKRCLKDEIVPWQELLEGKGNLTIPARTVRRMILELPDYYTAYPELEVAGGAGAKLEIHWAEAMHLSPDFYDWRKGNRAEIEGKYFTGIGDTWILEGGKRKLSPLYWIAGRYVEVYISTEDDPLTIHALGFRERRYPLESQAQFACADERLNEIQSILVRGIQMCSNETFMDCPYYEEMMYTGDTRLEILVSHILSPDTRLARKALWLFDSSRMASGLTQSRYPCKSTQVIGPFALWWVGMVHDALYWQRDTAFVRSLLPGVRQNIQAFERSIGEDGLLHGPEGWNTIDWVPAWSRDDGTPPEGHSGVSGVLNWQLIYTLSLYADLERRTGDQELADWAVRRAAELAVLCERAFWSEERGLLADTRELDTFCEHSQLFALLSGFLDPQKREVLSRNLFADPDLDRATIYFSHYYFEVCRMLGRMDKLMERMELWFFLKQMGFKTPMEMPEPSRSDCHAWSSHPLFHYQATILGVRPAEPGFRSVVIEPQPGDLSWAEGAFPWPGGGEIKVRFDRDETGYLAEVRLPAGLSGVLRWKGETWPVFEGLTRQKLAV